MQLGGAYPANVLLDASVVGNGNGSPWGAAGRVSSADGALSKDLGLLGGGVVGSLCVGLKGLAEGSRLLRRARRWCVLRRRHGAGGPAHGAKVVWQDLDKV